MFISDTLRLPEGAGLAFFIVMLILWTMAFVKRLHDLGKSGWWLWVPIYNLWLVLLILFVRGTRGENKYGHDPIQMKWLEKNAPSFISLPEKEQQKIIRQMRIATGEIEEDA